MSPLKSPRCSSNRNITHHVTYLIVKRKVFSVDVTRALKDSWRHPFARSIRVDGDFCLVLLCAASQFIIIISAVGEPHTVLSLMAINNSRPRFWQALTRVSDWAASVHHCMWYHRCSWFVSRSMTVILAITSQGFTSDKVKQNCTSFTATL